MLDPIGKRQVLQVIKELVNRRETTMIITESGADISMISDIIDRAIILHNGEIIADGDPRTVLPSNILTQIGVRRPQVVEVSLELRKYYQNFPGRLSVKELANNPYIGRKMITRPIWYIRIGDYRVFYHINEERKVVTLIDVVHRRVAYR